MSDKTKALLKSFGRVFAAAALTAYLGLSKAPLDLRLEDAVVLLNAGIGAALLTLVNFLRSGETRFGRGSEDIGMGGTDTLGEGGKVQIPPDGERVEPEVALAAEVGPVDSPPKDGKFRDWDGIQHDPKVVAEGNLLGHETPDVDFVEVEGQVTSL